MCLASLFCELEYIAMQICMAGFGSQTIRLWPDLFSFFSVLISDFYFDVSNQIIFL